MLGPQGVSNRPMPSSNRAPEGSHTYQERDPPRQAPDRAPPAPPHMPPVATPPLPPASPDRERATWATPAPPPPPPAPIEPQLPFQTQPPPLPPQNAGAPAPRPRGYWETVLEPSGPSSAQHAAPWGSHGGAPGGAAAIPRRGAVGRSHYSSPGGGDVGAWSSGGGTSPSGAAAASGLSSAASPRGGVGTSMYAGDRGREFRGGFRGHGAIRCAVRGAVARGTAARGCGGAGLGTRDDQAGSGTGGGPGGQTPLHEQQMAGRRGASKRASLSRPAAGSGPSRGDAADRSLHLVCPICGARFGHRDAKNNHIQEKHNDNETFKCRFPECCKIFGHRSSRSRHETAHRWPRGTGPGGRGR